MKRAALILLVAAMAAGAWQTTPQWIYGWNGAPIWLRLGPTLVLTNGQLDVSLPGISAPLPRKYGAVLTYDATKKAWPLPNTQAESIAVYVNGVRYSAVNYTISGGLLVAKGPNMAPEHEVMIDYDAR